MKNLLVVLIFSLMSSVVFAETINNPDKSVNVNSEQEAAVATILDYNVHLSDDVKNDDMRESKPECTIRGKFTITTAHGSVTWEGEITITGKSCLELLQQLLAQ